MLAITLSPWNGPSLPTVTGEAFRYALVVTGRPAQRVRLNALGIPPGWIGAFCTATLCAPMQVRFTLPADGRQTFEFGLIRENGSLPPTMRITIHSNDGTSKTLIVTTK